MMRYTFAAVAPVGHVDAWALEDAHLHVSIEDGKLRVLRRLRPLDGAIVIGGNDDDVVLLERVVLPVCGRM